MLPSEIWLRRGHVHEAVQQGRSPEAVRLGAQDIATAQEIAAAVGELSALLDESYVMDSRSSAQLRDEAVLQAQDGVVKIEELFASRRRPWRRAPRRRRRSSARSGPPERTPARLWSRANSPGPKRLEAQDVAEAQEIAAAAGS